MYGHDGAFAARSGAGSGSERLFQQSLKPGPRVGRVVGDGLPLLKRLLQFSSTACGCLIPQVCSWRMASLPNGIVFSRFVLGRRARRDRLFPLYRTGRQGKPWLSGCQWLPPD